jgi:hypothetical protein
LENDRVDPIVMKPWGSWGHFVGNSIVLVKI